MKMWRKTGVSRWDWTGTGTAAQSDLDGVWSFGMCGCRKTRCEMKEMRNEK